MQIGSEEYWMRVWSVWTNGATLQNMPCDTICGIKSG